ncbi:pyridoxal 5'-phosphate synthase subunit PdxT [Paraliobacillus quinghaiensis]|uniref:Pyridoxal 5'-phosphate synthase subunit PdxT n=1 Tax=Paraliobacillus quinghaiensis TaxID=470815 RepID=A0A917TY36_9BACI|nr:pyridoxal 5'-phosphate synthase glutaminase subunit PdxT [Paraliobacillus quinghaiensis]GGM43356.1 pyridoxal 5'-phosphate synthase subunit PdxT [Paraliobacillus quinghaiensis]
MTKIGVLGLQGAVREHVRSIEACGAEALIVKKKEQLAEIDGLILPGGESTTMRRLINQYDFFEPLQQFGERGKPIFGTCAGLILLATEIVGQDNAHLQLMNMKVERNAFGRQKDSFEAKLHITGVAEDFQAVFIRAPFIVDVGNQVEVLARHNDAIVAAREGHYLCSAFHPELTEDDRLTQYFVNMVEESKKELAS